MHTTAAEQDKIQGMIRQARALIQSGRQQIALLRPVWGAYLVGETLTRLAAIVEELEREVTLSRPDAAAERDESNEASKREKDLEIYL